MKKLLYSAVIATLVIFSSCDKNDSGDDNTFSVLTDEQNKENIEESGQELLTEMQILENEPAIETNAALVSFLDRSDPFEEEGQMIILQKTIAFSSVYASSEIEKQGTDGLMKSMLINPTEEPETIQEVYDDIVGVYSWNSTLIDWDYVKTGDKIVFEFPATENGTTNNASYTVSYSGYTGTNPIEDYDGDLPQNVIAELAVDNTTISKLTVDATYDSNGYPNSISTDFSIGQFVISASISNNNTSASTKFSFTHADKILLKLELSAKGNWTETNIENNTKYYKELYNNGNWEYIEITKEEYDSNFEDYTYEEVDVHKVVEQGNASFQLLNLKIVGDINTRDFGEKVIEIEDLYKDQEELEVNAIAEAMNEYINLSLRYADNNHIIAMVEAYPVSKEDTYTNWVYNEVTQTYDTYEVTETYYDIELRFVFADGSPVDFETYFGDDLEDLFTDLEEYLDELDTTYGK